mgnify:FL=1
MLGVLLGVALTVIDGVEDTPEVVDIVGVTVIDGVTVGVKLVETVIDGVIDGVTDSVGVTVGVTDIDGEIDIDGVTGTKV